MGSPFERSVWAVRPSQYGPGVPAFSISSAWGAVGDASLSAASAQEIGDSTARQTTKILTIRTGPVMDVVDSTCLKDAMHFGVR